MRELYATELRSPTDTNATARGLVEQWVDRHVGANAGDGFERAVMENGDGSCTITLRQADDQSGLEWRSDVSLGPPQESTRATVRDLVRAFAAGEIETARSLFHEKPVLIDGVYGLAAGWEAMGELTVSRPAPFFGVQRSTALYAGDHVAAAEFALDQSRPRSIEWLRLVDDKVIVTETYWMLREIGVQPDENYARDRHQRQVILPI